MVVLEIVLPCPSLPRFASEIGASTIAQQFFRIYWANYFQSAV